MNRSIVPSRRSESNRPAATALTLVALAMLALSSPLRLSSAVNAQEVGPAGTLQELAIESGEGTRCAMGQAETLKGKPGFGWVNKLTPPSYPATLRSISIGFERSLVNTGVKQDALYRIVVYLDPEGDGPANTQPPNASFIGRVRGTDISLMTFNLITPLTITGGSFVVGAIDDLGIANLPALFFSPGKSTPPGSESFFTVNAGAFWQKLSDSIPAGVCGPGSYLIRATVELGSIDSTATTKIKDPNAVEPWGVGTLGADVIVANLVSDNVTIIDSATNTFRTMPLVDPRVCASCGPPLGPFGVAGVASRNKVYVTLFGSNTIPSKEFPVDYSTVLPGRVAVLARQANGTYTQSLIAGVGIGPKFPAAAAGKLYVPCGGENRVDVINTATDQRITGIAVGPDPSSCTASLDESKIYVTNFGDGTISVIDTKTDTKIKDIPAPPIQFPAPVGGAAPAPATARNPWSGAVSPASGNLYVTYWATSGGDRMPNGALIEFDTCKDVFVRAVIDDTTQGTVAGSAGATGIPAPTAALTRDPATGRTLQAGGGGGGPFGIAACAMTTLDMQPAALVFTNDGLGIAAVLDARINQVVSAPAIVLASCPKPRGVACINVGVASGGSTRPTHFAYVACGQPDNSVVVIKIPELPENISTIPVIESAEAVDVLRLSGTGFSQDNTRIEVSRGAACLSFKKPIKFKKNGRILIQKGGLTDDSFIGDAINSTAIIRLVHPDGTTRVIKR